MSYGGYRDQSDNEFYLLLFVMFVIFIIISSLVYAPTRNYIFGSVGSITVAVSKGFSSLTQSFIQLGAQSEVGLADIRGAANQTKEEVAAKYQYLYKFDTQKVSSVQVGVDIETDNNLVKSVDDFVYFSGRLLYPQYMIEEFEGEPIQFFCKHPEVEQKKKYFTCQNTFDTVYISDTFNPNVAVECYYYGVDPSIQKFDAVYKIPMSQDGFTRVRVVNDPENLKAKSGDLKRYLIDGHPNYDFEGTIAQNSAGPLDIKLDINSFVTFDENKLIVNNEFSGYKTLSMPLTISITNSPQTIYGGQKSFSSKVSYVDNFRSAKVVLPNYVFLGCDDDRIRYAVENKNNVYYFNMAEFLKADQGKLKEKLFEKRCNLFFDSAAFEQENFESIVLFPISFETQFDYLLNYDTRVKILQEENKTTVKNLDFTRDVLVSLGLAGADNIDQVKLTKEQQNFKEYVNDRFKETFSGIETGCYDPFDFRDLQNELVKVKDSDQYKQWLAKKQTNRLAGALNTNSTPSSPGTTGSSSTNPSSSTTAGQGTTTSTTGTSANTSNSNQAASDMPQDNPFIFNEVAS